MNANGDGDPGRFRWQDYKGIDPERAGLPPTLRGGFFTILRRMFCCLLLKAIAYHLRDEE